MAATRSLNSRNEENEVNLMEADLNDPDIEARLYGEIYYSNETYPDNPTLLNPMNESNHSHHWSIDTQPGQSSKSPLVYAVNHNSQQFSTQDHYQKRKRHRALLDGPIDFTYPSKNPRNYPEDTQYPRSSDAPQGFGHKNDFTRENNKKRDNISFGDKLRRSRDQDGSPWRDNEVFMTEEDGEPDSTSLTALDDSLTVPDVFLPQKSGESSQKSAKSVDEASGGHSDPNLISKEPEQVLLIEISSKNDEKVPEIVKNSKYEIQGKKSRKKKFKSPPFVVDDTDSDDSILEVPVPPKPRPPVISLPDSDDNSSSEDESLVIMNKKSEECGNASKDSSSSSSGSLVIVDDSDDSGDGDDAEMIDDNLMINCTSVQKGVSRIQEIKRMREIGDKGFVVSQDDEESMTESEGMNWGSLEGKIGGVEGISQGQAVADLLHELSDGSDCRKNLLEDSEVSEKSSGGVDEGLMSLEGSLGQEGESKEDNATRDGLDEGGGTSEGEKRKNEENCEVGGEGEVSSRKKRKGNRKEISFEEYMLQPMPKGLRDYYNEPRGGDIMRDVKDIQRDMPKNPNRWAILDKDLCRVQRKKKSVCAICQREGHLRSRCPERPKAPICHICGVMGHMEPRCPDNKQCISCGRKYATCRKTCEHCNRLRCSQCNGRGHASANCPDNWRKYHQTTSGTAVKVPTDPEKILKPSNQLFCSNCSRRGHEATTCTFLRWSGHFIQPCYVRDYSIGPTYTSPPCHPRDLPKVDFREPINLERLGITQNNPSTYLFHFINSQSQDTTTWKESSLVPNHLKDVNYPSSSDKPIYPRFLRTQFKNTSVQMEIIVKRSYELQGIPVIIIRSPDDESREKLEILIRQWLVRAPDDKELMERCQRLPEKREELLKVLKSKFGKFKKKSSKNSWMKLEQCRHLLKRIAIEKTKNIKTEEAKLALRRKMKSLLELKYACVAATYKYLVIDTEMDALTSFYHFFVEIEGLPVDDVPPKLFMTAVWYCFEIFTPHLSPTIVSSMEIWERTSGYHIRGEEIYRMRYREGFRRMEEGGKGGRRIEDLLDLDLKGIEEINERGNREDVEAVDITGRSKASPVVNKRILAVGKSGSVKKSDPLMDLFVSSLPGQKRLKDCGKMKKTEAFKEEAKKKKEIDLKRRVLFNKQLGLPEEMPMSKDTREYTPEFLKEHTDKALEFMSEKNMGKLKAKATCSLRKTPHGVADKGTLINLWVMIRAEMIKRNKLLMGPTFSTGKKLGKKGGVS